MTCGSTIRQLPYLHTFTLLFIESNFILHLSKRVRSIARVFSKASRSQWNFYWDSPCLYQPHVVQLYNYLVYSIVFLEQLNNWYEIFYNRLFTYKIYIRLVECYVESLFSLLPKKMKLKQANFEFKKMFYVNF